MHYTELGLVNTTKMFADALRHEYAIPAFNFYNMETLIAILDAVADTNSPVILSTSQAAIKYMGADLLMGMIRGKNFKPGNIALHLDHGADFESCKRCVDMGFSSVMIDNSHLSISENIEQSRKVVEYAHKFDVTVEAELGVLAGIEDDISAERNIYTNPADVIKFVNDTNIDSLAIAIGTSHGAYKRKSDNEELRFDILAQIADKLPDFPLVLHGASNIPAHLVDIINKFGGDIDGARGIPSEQIKRAVSMNICKINIDSDARLAFTAAIRQSLSENPANFDPRKYLGSAMELIRETFIHEIKNIMNSANMAK